MTNITYFHDAIREYYSSSSASSSFSEHQAPPHHGGAAAEPKAEAAPSSSLSLYTAIGNAYLACVRPAIELEQQQEDDNDDSSTTPQPISDDSNDGSELACDSSETFSSNSIIPTPQSESGKSEYSRSKRFSFEELKSATRKFHCEVELGEGRFGRVFKGWIDENKLTATKPGKGIAVAIKMLRQLPLQGQDEWWTEVKYLGRLCHPNLVRLLGYCIDNDKHLLVYEFMPRGTLDNHLFKKDTPPLCWSVRMKIALGAAKGLSFLHSTSVNVIHRDFKSSNILLDMNYNAKISDFGLAMDGPTGGKGYIDTRYIVGTFGYMAPEYVRLGHLTAKNDVYGFGVVLLEMLTGQRAYDINRRSGEWEEPYLEHRHKMYDMYDIADSRLEGQYSLEGFEKAANLALKCVSIEGMSRPNMDEVVKVLEEL